MVTIHCLCSSAKVVKNFCHSTNKEVLKNKKLYNIFLCQLLDNNRKTFRSFFVETLALRIVSMMIVGIKRKQRCPSASSLFCKSTSTRTMREEERIFRSCKVIAIKSFISHDMLDNRESSGDVEKNLFDHIVI